MNSTEHNLRADFAAFLVFSLSTAATLSGLAWNENPPEVLHALVLWLAVILALETVVLWLLLRWIGGSLAPAFLGLTAAANLWSLYLVHLHQGLFFELVYTGFVALALIMMLAATSGHVIGRALGTVALSAIPLLALTEVLPDLRNTGNQPEDELALIAEYEAITLGKRPNIYVLSFDALIPGAAARQFFDIEALPYETWLAENDTWLLDNAFVTDTPSVPSHDALMNFDDKHHFRGTGYFAGRLRSPVEATFHANGYRVETGNSIPYFFGATGPHVERHLFVADNIISDSSICKFATPRVWSIGVFGFCRLEPYFRTTEFFDSELLRDDPDAPLLDTDWHKEVLRILSSPTDGPRLFLYYYFYPIGHAPNDYVTGDPEYYKAYRKRFLTQLPSAKQTVQEVVETVRRADPDAIMMIFGDHGTKISRTADWARETEFWVQDNHWVLMALPKTEHICSAPDLSIYNTRGYYTAGRVLASITRCLANEPEALDSIVHFHDKFDFAKYLPLSAE